MAISDRVRECIDKLNANEYESALIQLSIAFDGTAKKEYPRIKKVGERFKAFLKANQDIITYFTFGGVIFIDCEVDGYTLEQIIYKVLRCGLLHEGSIPGEIEFVDELVWGRPGGKWRLPKSYVLGGLLAVIGANNNAGERVPEHYVVVIKGNRYQVNQLWGNSELIRRIMQSPNANFQGTVAIAPAPEARRWN